jgi:hypothetical protein
MVHILLDYQSVGSLLVNVLRFILGQVYSMSDADAIQLRLSTDIHTY